MEVSKNTEDPATLEAGLNFWIRQEQKFQSLFGKEALKDREFLKMKLRHYDSLWYKYKNAPLDIEGQLMRNMLKFQRRKIDKSMHRGLLRQIFRKVNSTIESNRVQKTQLKIKNNNQLGLYNENSPKPEIHGQVKEVVVQQRKEEQTEKTELVKETATEKVDIIKQKKIKSYSHNHAPRYKHKQRKSNGIHH